LNKKMVAKSYSGMNQDGISTRVSARKYPSEEYFEFKAQIHDRLLDLIDLSLLDKLDRETLTVQIRRVVEKILREETFKLPLNLEEREKIFTEIIDEVLGLGPLEPLLKDPTISDILVNTYKSIYLERYGKLEPTDARFKDEDHLMRIIDKIVSSVGHQCDYSTPRNGWRHAFHTALCRKSPGIIGSDRLSNLNARNFRNFEGSRKSKVKCYHLGRHRQRKNHPAKRPFTVYSGKRAHCHN
jgi:hypothetical protein